MPRNDEPTAALTSPAAVIAALLLFVAIVVFVALAQLWPADEPDAMDPMTAPPAQSGAIGLGLVAPDVRLTNLQGEVASISNRTGRTSWNGSIPADPP